MRRTLHLPRALPAVLVVLALALTGCSGDENTTDAPTSGTSDSTSETLESSGDDDTGRVFDSTDDAVIQAVEAALDPQKVEWDDKTLRVYVDGSADDPTAGLNCITLNTLIADDEQGVFVYSDGEFDCEQRR